MIEDPIAEESARDDDSRSLPPEDAGGVRESLWGLAAIFLRMGATSFGGPAAHIAMMEDEFVRRRRWLTHEEFLDLLGAANLIPGPNSTEMAMHIGLKRAGWPGFLVAGCCFILPAFLIVMGCGWVYVRYGTVPEATGFLAGVKPVIIAVVAQALWGFGRAALKTMPLRFIAGVTLLVNVLGLHEVPALFAAGCLAALIVVVSGRKNRTVASGLVAVSSATSAAAPDAVAAGALAAESTVPGATASGVAAAGAAAAGATVGVAVAPAFGLGPLFLFFVKVGSVLYGSGYVLLAFLRADLVERFGWLTEGQLLDAVAVGQVTPGPVFTAATFIGYVLGGWEASVVATVGIFLPAFFFVSISAPLIPRIRRSRIAGAFLDGVNAASLALMALVLVHLARPVAAAPVAVALTVVAAVLLVRYRVNSSWLVLGGGLIGALLL